MGHRFGLDFAGRTDAQRAVHLPPRGTLVADPEASVRFDDARHVFIEGDNLEVLKILSGPYHGSVQAIYVDPPYNTGRDFVYRDRWSEDVAEYLRRTNQTDERGTPLVSNPSTNGRYHSVWLAMMYPRLVLARRLLRDDGLLFVSIDDHEVHHLRMLLDEIFGEDCFVAQVVVVGNRGGRDYLRVAIGHEYVLVYGASPDAPVRELPRDAGRMTHGDDRGAYEPRDLRNRNPKFHPANRPNLFYPIHVAAGRPGADRMCPVSLDPRPGYDVAVEPRNREGRGSVWRWGKDRLREAIVDDDANASEVVARRKRDGSYGIYEKHRKTTTRPRALWDEPELRSETGTTALRQRLGAAVFDHPKPVELIRRCIQIGTDADGIVLDFFAGSGTTAEAVLAQNRLDGGRRRFVLVQLDEPLPPSAEACNHGHATVADITRARIRAACESREGVRCYRAVPRNDVTWTPPPARDAEGYLSALRGHERARAGQGLEPWDVALRLGFRLDASVRRLDDAGTVLLRDEACSRSLVVSPRADVGLEEVEAWDLPGGTEIVCHDHALDDATAVELATRFHIWRL